MDLVDLRVFEAVARLGSMSRASEHLHTVQSNVTARIRNMEEDLGVPLFERHSRGVTPTPAGERLLPFARRAQELMAEARQAVTNDDAPAGALTLGSLETTAALRLSPLLATYASAWPAVDLILRTGTTREMVEAVLAREVEGAFVCGPVDHRDLVAEPACREELVAVTAPHRGPLDAVLAAGAPKIAVLRAGCSYRQRLEEILARRGATGLRVMEFGTIDTLMAAAGAGIGVTLLPHDLARPWEARGAVAVHRLPPRESLVETLFVRRRDGYVSPALRAFLDMTKAELSVPAAA
jgi:DNA-binding transcriptional LysR family regulator